MESASEGETWKKEKRERKYGAMLEKKRVTKNRVDDFLNVFEIRVCWSFRLSHEIPKWEYV